MAERQLWSQQATVHYITRSFTLPRDPGRLAATSRGGTAKPKAAGARIGGPDAVDAVRPCVDQPAGFVAQPAARGRCSSVSADPAAAGPAGFAAGAKAGGAAGW